ncbi:MAG: UvrB/UvrC motif-containing protein [Pontiellaceae bacterium]|nr:hypothetical protein [Kiritimatiellaceae bacterium]|tara:strand:+ start:92 stop:607 length:516 start_codon:yes stop_codon:yes gene_type:complete
MKCEFCNKNNATIHLTQVVNGSMKKLNICQPCAEKNGIDLNSPISITDVLMGIDKKWTRGELSDSVGEYDLACSRCQMTRAEFKKQARLGCPECYSAFSAELNTITQAMHHSRQHVGKIPAREGNEVKLSAQITSLQHKIDLAIKKEEYEKAASLRDEVRKLKLLIESDND